MSTFSGLNTAWTGLSAARNAFETTGNNITNVGTEGYVRQRAELASTAPLQTVGRLGGSPTPGQGVVVTNIARLADAHVDARVRGTAAVSGQAEVRASGVAEIEGLMREPGQNGLSALLNDFWAGWEDVANQPGADAPAAVVIERGRAVADRIVRTQTELTEQWASERGRLETLVAEVNAGAATIADLNSRIRSTIAGGGNPNALLDQRAQAAGRLAELTGASLRANADGTADVVLGGSPLVSGTTARSVSVAGPEVMDDGGELQLMWDHRPDPVAMDSGSIAGALTLLAPTSGGAGGPIAEASAALDRIATALADKVNTASRQGVTTTGAPGGDFFTLDPTRPAASLRVVAASAADLATGTAGAGALDGSNASRMAQQGAATDGPDALWSALVIQIGVSSVSESQSAVSAAVAHTSATEQQQAASGVSLDEENVALLAQQHAYQGAARVMTAIDEMLDTLINRTGVVGR